MMAVRALAVVVAIIAAAIRTALGASYTVGAPGGSWDMQMFNYSRVAHNVLEVSKAGYDSCNISRPIATFQTGNDTVRLAAVGSRYFVCGVSGHCVAGMKVAVQVQAADKARQCRFSRPSGRRQRVRRWCSAATSAGVESLMSVTMGSIAVALMALC
ncbi:hypothetical protein GUJ93_ZPchr0010g8537 [Zizania palustris]|uniref:Phytocyanin domain-containing protein n=1 Tax=Zizania palustris TaxID=103762 RepID=A0A8J5WEG0_ZIZPA|nr:hypothetical protein GUJ93_ZPchr0010g8537 [Zizania palustris]